MRLLAVETSTLYGSVALFEGETMLAELTYRAAQTHSKQLMATIDKVLSLGGIEAHKLEAIAVSLGPGSFTALRIGVATAKSLAHILDIPMVGRLSLDILAEGCGAYDGRIICLIEVKKGELFIRKYESKALEKNAMDDISIIAIKDLPGVLKTGDLVVGEFIHRQAPLAEAICSAKAIIAPIELALPRASVLARMAMGNLKRGEADSYLTLEPVYIKMPPIKTKKRC